MLLAVDAGNTNITLGLFRASRLVRQARLPTRPGISAKELARELRRALGAKPPSAVVYGSVVPRLDKPFAEASRALWGIAPVCVTPKSPLGFSLRVDRPSEVGADRVLNTLAALRRYGAPAVVIDFGTATTFDCVSKGGDYLGGAILLGPKLAAKALKLYTAKLPEVEMARTRRVIGRNTVECIQAGLYHGYFGMVEHVLAKTLAELRGGRGGKVHVIATGGLARLFHRALPQVTAFDPDLTLHGLRHAHDILSGLRGPQPHNLDRLSWRGCGVVGL